MFSISIWYFVDKWRTRGKITSVKYFSQHNRPLLEAKLILLSKQPSHWEEISVYWNRTGSWGHLWSHTDIIPHSVLNMKKCWQDLHDPWSVLRARKNVLPLNRLSSMQYCIHCSYQNDPLAYEPPQPLQDYPVVIVGVLLVYLSPNSRGHHIQVKRQRNLFTW